MTSARGARSSRCSVRPARRGSTSDDHDWDTSYVWSREGVSYSRCTVEWRIRRGTPAGTYRLVQQGNWKNGCNGKVSAYTGTSRAFQVR
ncbi:neutral/alkaline non-lysosomal ceramidase C-terminal domain-containing protein [Dermacoccus nishinomiyaensis]|nr:neutral/alkaline non-lysosomal ceramidase C-terminal domain-containing protein [Dermacoccus nishinomiyaensis]MCI0153354.1 neutral/alkaline non-lysosomal ceramidase C-terminal domain-containing protein [Dermacoccus nishinomiyaensis]